MARLLICSGKKFLKPFGSDVLISYVDINCDSLDNWIKLNYRVSVVKEQPIPKTDIILITVLDEQHLFCGELISFSRLSQLLTDEPAVIDFLSKIRSSMDIQLQYGITNGKLISIDELSEDQKGLHCNCTCPGCGSTLIARLGKQKRHHFGHHGATCNLAHAQQTALHMLAKEIIEQDQLFAFPGYSVSLEDVGWDDNYRVMYNMPRSLEYRKAYTAKCTSVTLEKKVSSFVPDIVVDIHGRTCLIEIAVTHFVDEAKQEKIGEVGLPVIEVDLSSFIGQQITRAIIREALVSQTENKKWLYNPLREEASDWAKVEYAKLYNNALEKEEAERQKWLKRSQEKTKKEKIREKKREETAFLLEDLFEPENYKYELQQLRSDVNFQVVLQNLHLQKEIELEIPFFLDIPITGEMVFACDRRIWQAALFDKFIYYRKMDENETVRIGMNKIQACVRDHMDFVPIDWKLASKATVLFNGRRQEFTLFYDVIRKYLDYLHYIGFVSKLYYGVASVERVKTLVPPNEERAKLLQSAIERVDQFAPDVDIQVERILHPPYIPKYYSWNPHNLANPTIDLESEESIQSRIMDEYNTGCLQAWEYDFDSEEPFYDRYSRRWLKCKNCGAIKREEEMLSYGGRNGVNKGICKTCKSSSVSP